MDQGELPAVVEMGTPPDAASGATVLALSHSQVEIFQQCPRRWWLLKRAEVPRAPSEALILGDAVHQAIEADLMARLEDPAVGPASLDTLTQAFARALAGRLAADDPAGLLGAERHVALRAQGPAVLRAYHEQVATQVSPVEVEREFVFSHPDDASIIFTGRMDAVTDRAAWGRTIVDWKVPRRAWRVGEEHRRIQAAAYLWADQQRLRAEDSPQPAGARVTFVTFPPATSGLRASSAAAVRMVDTRTTSRTPAQLRAYADLVRFVAARIRDREPQGESRFSPQPNKLCGWCEVRGSCAAGQRFVRSSGCEAPVPEVSPEGSPEGSAAGS